MDTQHIVLLGRMGGRHLSEIQEEADSREHSTCIFPPIYNTAGQQKQTAEREKERETERETERERGRASRCDPAALALYEQQRKLEDNRSLLEELSLIEAELRQSVLLEEERQRESLFLRQQENRLRWENLRYLSLNQRVNKPWVSSYFRKFPMHIYCLPIQAVNHRARRRSLKRRK